MRFGSLLTTLVALSIGLGVAGTNVAVAQQNPVKQVITPAQTAAPAETKPVMVPLQKMPELPGQMSTPMENNILSLQSRVLDFNNLGRYREENAKLPPPATGEKRVIFFGDSITDAWGRKYGKFFPGKPYVNRGIGGQTSQQMLVRFQQDVVRLKPAAVVILAGTNDIAGNTGPENMQMLQDNIVSMVTIAKANHIKVVLASILPSKKFSWNPDVHPQEMIRTTNRWIEQYCQQENLVFLNYYPALAEPDGGIKEDLAADKTVHPNDAGYAVMATLAEEAVQKTLQ